LVTGLNIDDFNVSQCKACLQAKAHTTPFPKEVSDSANSIGDIIISDVWGLAATEGIS
jgi:hypothetical protein